MVRIAEVSPRSGGGWRCRVEIEDDGARTTHDVTVSAAGLSRWGMGTGRDDVEDLVRRSFDFLLEREPAASILRSFDLAVIPEYFPEYDRLFPQSD